MRWRDKVETSDRVETQRTSHRRVRIEWGDCDPAGIVYFPRYFAIFDACTAGAFEAVGLPKPTLIEKYGIVGFPAVDVHGSFSLPCTFGDDVLIDTRISEWGRSSFKVHHRLLKGEATAVQGFEVRVWTGRDPAQPSRLRAQPIPREVIDRFRESGSSEGRIGA
jgi:4-hydroxybenzoyl-CoA thioesterase